MREWGEGQRERERETESEAGPRLWAASIEHDMGLELMNCEIMTWAGVGRFTNWTTRRPEPYQLLNGQTSAAKLFLYSFFFTFLPGFFFLNYF